MTATIINSFIALILGVYAFKYRRQCPYLIFILFLYISIHYSYAIIAIFGTPKYIMLCRSLRATPQLGVKLIGIGFLLFSAVLLVSTKKDELLSLIQSRSSLPILHTFIIWFMAVILTWIHGISQGEYPSLLTIKNMGSVLFMLVMIFIIAATIPDTKEDRIDSLKKIFLLLFVLVIVMDLFALTQIVTQKTFAGTYNHNGKYARRACALLYNPNVLGIWCSLIAAISAYGFHIRAYSKKQMSAIAFFCALGIFLSGSRSGLLICIFIFTLIFLLQLKCKYINKLTFIFFPLFSFALSLICIGALFKIVDRFTEHSMKVFNLFSALVDRFAFMPREIYSYAIFKLTHYLISLSERLYDLTGISIFSNSYKYFSDFSKIQSVKPVFVNIEGRFASEIPLPDNGYLAMYHDAGWLGLVSWLILLFVIVTLGVKTFRINPGVDSVYALSAVCSSLFAAFFIRAFQVYPIWIMVAIVLGFSLSCFHTVLHQEGFLESS